MIRTLFVHEFLRTRGMLGVLLAAATAFVVVGSLLVLTGWPALATIGLIAGILAVGALLPLAQLGLAVDYWRSAYGRTGYLTQTLPVAGSTIYGARLLYGAVVTAALGLWSVVLGLLMAYVVARPATPPGESTFGFLMAGLREEMPLVSPAVGIGFALLIFVFAWGYLTQYYFAASIGSESPLGRFGAFGPILVWFGLYLVFQVVLFVGIVAVPFGIGSVGGSLGIVPVDLWAAMRTGASPDVMPLGFVPAFLLLTAALIWRTAHSWSRKVSLA